MLRITSAAVIALIAGSASAQSLNVDLNTASGPGSGVPSNAFAGAAGQPGFWNSLAPGSSGSFAMMGLTGSSSGVTITRQGNGFASSGIGSGGTDYQRLIRDYSDAFQPGGVSQVQLNGLDEGLYRVVVYAHLPGAAGTYNDNGFNAFHTNYLSVSVGATNVGAATTTDTPGADTFVEGKTHQWFTVRVPAGAPAVTIRSAADAGYSLSHAALNGFQLVKYDGSRLYVKHNAAGLNTGKDWANAFTDLQTALRFAKESQGAITEVWVAAGTYFPASSDRTKSFKMIDGVKIIGGFSGTESSVAQRVEGNTTYLSGDLGISRNITDNSYRIVDASGVNSSAVLDSVAIVSGNANGTPGVYDAGSGLWASNGSPTVRNVVFTGNRGDRGGAVNVEYGGPTFANCTFTGNSCTWDGGAIRWVGDNTGWFPPVLKIANCEFIGNTATQYGGAIMTYNGPAWIAGSVFTGNTAPDGGAFASAYSNPTIWINNCTFANNSATNGVGGGIYALQGPTVNVRNSILYQNTKTNGACLGYCAQAATVQGATVNFAHSIVQGMSLTPSADFNSGMHPLFIDADGADNIAGTWDDDFRLAVSSPAIDAGSVSQIASDFADVDGNGVFDPKTTIDLDGNPRRFDVLNVADTGMGAAPLPDMGAYEAMYQVACPADWDQSGGVDGDDIAVFFADWQAGNADIDASGGTDGDDISYFFARWQAGC